MGVVRQGLKGGALVAYEGESVCMGALARGCGLGSRCSYPRWCGLIVHLKG